MNFKFQLLIVLLAGGLLFSCVNEDDTITEPNTKGFQTNSLSSKNQEIFAESVSKLLSEKKSARDFIKRNALEHFDIDNNILYHKIKDQKVEENLSFRDLLIQYADNEEDFINAENESPLVSFFIPDLSYIIDFSAELWDTSNEQIAVSYQLDANSYQTSPLVPSQIDPF